MNKDKELARLAGVVFEGAEPKWEYAAMDDDGLWNWFDINVFPRLGYWGHSGCMWLESDNQPETDLPWQETLICRSDYE